MSLFYKEFCQYSGKVDQQITIQYYGIILYLKVTTSQLDYFRNIMLNICSSIFYKLNFKVLYKFSLLAYIRHIYNHCFLCFSRGFIVLFDIQFIAELRWYMLFRVLIGSLYVKCLKVTTSQLDSSEISCFFGGNICSSIFYKLNFKVLYKFNLLAYIRHICSSYFGY